MLLGSTSLPLAEIPRVLHCHYMVSPSGAMLNQHKHMSRLKCTSEIEKGFILDRCGFGCQIHNLVFCLITSYATERMLVLKSTQWSYFNTKYEDFLQPFSDSCPNEESGRTKLPDNNLDIVLVLDNLEFNFLFKSKLDVFIFFL